MIVYLSILVALIGLIMYFIAGNTKVVDCGRIMFACGILAFLLKGDAVISLLGK